MKLFVTIRKHCRHSYTGYSVLLFTYIYIYFEYTNDIYVYKGSSILLMDKCKSADDGEIHDGFIDFLIPILAATTEPVLPNILNKVAATVDDKIKGSTCAEQCSQDDEGAHVTKNSELFFFVTDTMEIVRDILYRKILPLFVPHRPKPRDSSYIDSMWSLFGFHVETEPPEDDDQVFCNGSIFALIFVLYFGYLFMATKCVNAPKYYEDSPRFIPYLMAGQEEIENAAGKQLCCHHQHQSIDQEDEMDTYATPYDYPNEEQF